MEDKCYYCTRNFYCNKNVCEIEIKERENLNFKKLDKLIEIDYIKNISNLVI